MFKLSSFALLLLTAGVKAQDAVPEPVSLYMPTEMVETVEPHFMLLNEENIIPPALDARVAPAVAAAVIEAAHRSGVARI